MSKEVNILNLSNKSALITGAGSGIGRETAILFSKLGCNELILVGRTKSKLEQTKRIIEENKTSIINVEVCELDLENIIEVESMCLQWSKSRSKLDILVNNAGHFSMNRLEETSSQEWEKHMKINLQAPFVFVRGLVALLIKSKKASVINISSTLAQKPIPHCVSYNSAKAALLQMTRSLALELAKNNIRVNSIMPAVVDTQMFANRYSSKAEQFDALKQMAKFHPLGRVGAPEDIANAIAFLASDLSSWITGVSLPVDGGMLCT